MNTNTRNMDQEFFQEYTSHDALLKYTRATAGYGISYLLDHDYKDVYLQALATLPAETRKNGIRMLEYGCGGGMNLVHLVSVVQQAGIPVREAVGTDFSPVLIEAAKRESKNYLRTEDQGKIQFHVAKNESLVADLSTATGLDNAQIQGGFDFVFGVNTMRYCHHGGGGREMDAARDIMALLKPGGVCVNIDMNNRFPAFRSDLKNKLRRIKEEECYIPTLEEYVAPFRKTGFEILREEHFCWVSHSAGKGLCFLLRCLSPFLDALCKSRAMRSLVVARKPAK